MAEKKYIIDNSTLMAEWDWEKNRELNLLPEKLTFGSGKKVWWKCQKGHEWQATIDSRGKAHKCPYCLGKYAIKGKTDLQTVNPNLAKEWNYEKNDGLTPMDVLPNSHKKVWWICKKGHEWQAILANRSKGRGCPFCSSWQRTSFPEYALLYYLKKYDLEIIHSYKAKGYELDIYIPSKKIAIEYDGGYWHKNKEKKDLEKNRKCKEEGIKLYRIREGLQPLNDSSIDFIVEDNKKALSIVLQKILCEITETNVAVDLEEDAVGIENLRAHTEKENSFAFCNQEIAKEWNYKKNGKLKPENFSPNSNKKVWWICKKGHEWQAIIGDRKNGAGCPYCSSKRVLLGETDLSTINPSLANEWNYDKNNGLTPMEILPNSNKKIWWKCQRGHEWQATVNSRNRGNGCPYCSGRYAIKGETDLQTVNPSLATEWNYKKNNGLTPMDIPPSSNKKAWWICKRGHEWQAVIGSRIKGHGCPYCSNQNVIHGYNDLSTINPSLAKEWNYNLNKKLKPEQFTTGSGKKVWWRCVNGHEWQATISNRSNGRGCPECAKQKRMKNKNKKQ